MKPYRLFLLFLVVIFAVKASGQTFTELYGFTRNQSLPDGANPQGGVLLSGNTLYGTTFNGGTKNAGMVYSLSSTGGVLTAIHSFTNGSFGGFNPSGDLVLSGGTLFGTTGSGGKYSGGTVYSISTNGGGFTVLHDFTNSPDGAQPTIGLILSGTRLYGATYTGGRTNSSGAVAGTLFSINTDGSGYTNFYNFTGGDDGRGPVGLVFAKGTLYGITINATYLNSDGLVHWGTVFSVSTNGSGFKPLYSFTNTPDGSEGSGLCLLGNTLYGTTLYGGASHTGTLFAINTDGSNYSILHDFSGVNPDGATPVSVIAAGNVLYGATKSGGTGGYGTVYSYDTGGSGFSTLYSFTDYPDGMAPMSDLLLSGNLLYGTSDMDGSGGYGTVFSLSLPPPPPSITNIIYALNGQVTLGVLSPANSTNILLVATNLAPPVAWLPLSTNIAGVNGSWQFVDTNANNFPTRFYRAAKQ